MDTDPLHALMDTMRLRSREPYGSGNRRSQLHMLVQDVLTRLHGVSPQEFSLPWSIYGAYLEPLRAVCGKKWDRQVAQDLADIAPAYDLTAQDIKTLNQGDFANASERAISAMARIISIELRVFVVEQLIHEEAGQ